MAAAVVGGEELGRTRCGVFAQRRPLGYRSHNFFYAPRRQRDELGDRLRRRDDLEHGALGGDALVGGDGVEGTLVGADDDEAADAPDQAKGANHRDRRRGLRDHGCRGLLEFSAHDFFGFFGRKRFFGVTALASSREM